MKRLITAVLFCSLLLSGCGDSSLSETITETTTEQTTVTMPTDLTEEKMEIWETMPDVVTMRVLVNFVDETVEVMYIEKSGTMKRILYNEIDESFSGNYLLDTEWREEKFKCVLEAEVCGTIDVKKLIELYDVLLHIDTDSKIKSRQSLSMCVETRTTDRYEIYANRNNVDGTSEILMISMGQMLSESVHNDPNADNAYIKYVEIDPFREVNDSGFTY